MLQVRQAAREVEKYLQGTQDKLNSQFNLTAHDQRVMFFCAAIHHADYYWTRKTRQKDNKTIHRPTAAGDLKEQKKLRQQIATTASKLASILRQHHLVSNRLNITRLDCDPLHLIMLMNQDKKFQDENYLGNIQNEFLQLQHLYESKRPSYKSEIYCANFIETLAKKARKPEPEVQLETADKVDQIDLAYLNEKLQLGIEINSQSSHFLTAFMGYLYEQTEEFGGYIPNALLNLTAKCWAGLMTSLLSDGDSDGVSEKSAQALLEKRKKLLGDFEFQDIDPDDYWEELFGDINRPATD